MIVRKYRKNVQGQALVELMVLLPLLLLFMAAAVPIIVHGMAAPWLDERLALRHLAQDDEQIHRILLQTHEQDLLPPYFDRSSINETSQSASMGITLTALGITFPGEIIKKVTSTTIPDSGWLNWKFFDNPQVKNRRISRSFTVAYAPFIRESQVSEYVEQLSLMHVASEMKSLLERIGIKLLHLNLDAIPEAPEKG